MKTHYHHYNKKLKPFARSLRNDSTKAEVKIWSELLRNKKMMGYPFLRQRPIGNFIADFFCKELKLVIEIDGYSHQLDEVITKDKIKTTALEQMGYSIIRFTDDEVMGDIDAVGRSIEDWIVKYQNS